MPKKTLLACLCLLACLGCAARPGATPASPPPREPLVPTPIRRVSAAILDPGVTPTAVPVKTPAGALRPVPQSDRTRSDMGVPSEERTRFGVGAPGEGGPIAGYAVERLGIGWYLNWRVEVDPARPGGAAFWQMVRVGDTRPERAGSERAGYQPDVGTIHAAAAANPGSTWIIGNEPDVIWQDNTTPERYAELYHELYHLLKAADPACRVAIGGVSQPTPLRLAYLERVLDAYRGLYGEPMPVDVWNVHGFVLREERDSWGVGIPPGFDDDAGILYEIDDHDDLEAFRGQILAFRRWMADHGQRDRPLALSEYGILMPPDYGYDEARVEAFMVATFDYLVTATDERVGYPRDGNRLVQWWAWYSLADTTYPTGNLFDPETKALTPLGSAFARYAPPGSDDGG
jgi:hypothetical protein